MPNDWLPLLINYLQVVHLAIFYWMIVTLYRDTNAKLLFFLHFSDDVEAIERFYSIYEGRKLVANIDRKGGTLLHLHLRLIELLGDIRYTCVNASIVSKSLASIDRKGCKNLIISARLWKAL